MEPESIAKPRFVSRIIVTMNAAPLVCPTAAITPIPFDTIHYDSLDEYVIATTRFIAKRSGFYLFHAQTEVLITLANGQAGIVIEDVVNARDLVAAYYLTIGEIVSMQVQGVIHLNVGDAVVVGAENNTGANITLSNNTFQTKFTAHRLS